MKTHLAFKVVRNVVGDVLTVRPECNPWSWLTGISWTKDPAHVTCKRCQRTNAYKAAVKAAEGEVSDD